MNTQENNTTALAISTSAENVSAIVSNTPRSYSRNLQSHDNCLAACSQLLDTIHATGMTDDLDQQAAKYLDRTRRTVKAMNDLRAPLTKLFDQVRREFTTLENDIDPSRAGTIPFQLQQLRNQYAARRREEEEARRRAEEAARARAAAREGYSQLCADDIRARFNQLINSSIAELTRISNNITLDTIDAATAAITAFPTELPSFYSSHHAPAPLPGLPAGEARQIQTQALASLIPQLRDQYATEIGDCRADILDRLPSRKAELQRAAQAAADEAEQIRADIARREAAEAARRDAERLAREQEEAQKAQALKAAAEATTLFDLSQAAAPAYQPKAKVTKKINITAHSGYMQVLSMWWAKEGSGLPKEELDKIFKKMITFCEKVANKEGELLTDPGIQYIDDVKAR